MDIRRVMASGIVTLGVFGAAVFVLYVLDFLWQITWEPPLWLTGGLVAACWLFLWWRTDPS